jgi:thiol-disulfide isomerase/thioredoxin
MLMLVCIQLNNQAYGLELTSMDGKVTNLAKLVGDDKWSVAVFWSHSCHICRQETPAINQFHLKNKDSVARVIGISIDGNKKKPLIKKFMADTSMQFPSYITQLPTMAIDFVALTQEGFRGTPTFLIFDPKGALVAMQVGQLRMDALDKFIKERS